jgi:hypothetical protein
MTLLESQSVGDLVGDDVALGAAMYDVCSWKFGCGQQGKCVLCRLQAGQELYARGNLAFACCMHRLQVLYEQLSCDACTVLSTMMWQRERERDENLRKLWIPVRGADPIFLHDQ